jgi:predicted anti-sigma-YlaC factor YlaD
MTHIDEFTLNEYADNAMADEQRAEVEAHLQECADCQAVFAELQQLFFALDSAIEAPFTVDVSAVLEAQIEQEVVKSEKWSVKSGLLLVFEIVAAGVLLFLLWPTVQEWMQLAQRWQTQFAFNVTWPELVSWTEINRQITAVSTDSIQAVFDQIQATSIIDLAAMQWVVLIGVALIIRLAGNRLIFTNDSGGSHG